jgi:predicted nucleic acid-binding protein
MRLRLEVKKNNHLNISYADALGYHLAMKLDMKYLTGDAAFEDLDNVEFVR